MHQPAGKGEYPGPLSGGQWNHWIQSICKNIHCVFIRIIQPV